MKQVVWMLTGIIAAALALPARAGDAMPARLSALSGWHGVQVKQEAEACTLAFPPQFGATRLELRFLVKLANQDVKFNDLNCMLDVYAPLDQLKRLAVEQQNEAAARLILFAPETGALGIDGEVAEGFANTYQTPVLMGYRKLSALIPPARQARLAQDVCVGMFSGDTETVPDQDALIAHLKAVHMEALAAQIRRECAREAKGQN